MGKRKVFVIGDSISIHYGPYLKQCLGNKFDYDRKRGLEIALKDLDNPVGANAGDSRMVLEYLKEEASKGTKYDILLINCGAHDVRVDRNTKKIQVPLAEYKENLASIIDVAVTMSNKVIWVSTTPIKDAIHNKRKVGFLRFEKDTKNYDEAAKNIMSQKKITVIDLYKFVENLGDDVYYDHIHFNEETRKLQAEYIADNLGKIIKND